MKEKPFLRGIAFCPDGNSLAAMDVNNSIICFWDKHTGKRIRSIDTLVKPTAFAFHDEKELILRTTSEAQLERWDVISGKRISTYKSPDNFCMFRLSPDGRLIVSTGRISRRVLITDYDTGCEIMALDAKSTVLDIGFTPDGLRIVALCDGGVIRIWDSEIDHLQGGVRK